MAIPDYQDCMLPLLRLASDGNEHRIRDAIQHIADEFELTEEERRELLPSGGTLIIASRVGWARTYLKKAGLLEDPRRGFFRITDRGQDVLSMNVESIGTDYLKQFPEFLAFQKPASSDNVKLEESEFDSTPDDLVAAGYRQIRATLSDELLTQLKAASASFFERIVVRLLVAMGYGGNLKDAAATVLGKTGDEGVDGVINEDKLGLDVIYVQAKKWDQVVGRPEIQKFAGALLGKKARKGVFITTSRFSGDAIEYAANIDSRIVLIDGTRLTGLMIEHDVGVSTYDTYRLKRIDSDFFVEE